MNLPCAHKPAVSTLNLPTRVTSIPRTSQPAFQFFLAYCVSKFFARRCCGDVAPISVASSNKGTCPLWVHVALLFTGFAPGPRQEDKPLLEDLLLVVREGDPPPIWP